MIKSGLMYVLDIATASIIHKSTQLTWNATFVFFFLKKYNNPQLLVDFKERNMKVI